VADIDAYDANEGVLLKEDMKFVDPSGKQINGDLVFTNRQIIFFKKREILHSSALEMIRSARAESSGHIGAYVSIDLELPDGRVTRRYKGSVVQVNRILVLVESVLTPGSTIPHANLDKKPRSSAQVKPKSAIDTCCQGVICCMWFFVGLIFRVIMTGATITPGAELIPIGFILLVFGVTCWWVGIKGKKAWLCYGAEVGSDKPKSVYVGQRSRQTTPRPTQNLESIYAVEDMTAPLKCPKCGAVFSYRKKDITWNMVKCQNCFEDFNVE